MRLKTLVPVLMLAFAAAYACDEDSPSGPHNAAAPDSSRLVTLETTMGDITIELFPEKAPITVANFRRYASEHFYDGLIFHRVIQNFVNQGGGFTPDMVPRAPTHPPIENEAGNGLSNARYTIGMARSSVVNSATSQFFINTKDNTFLDHKDDTPQGFGYAVFGRVVAGMDIVDAMNQVPTGSFNGYNDVPLTPIVIRHTSLGRPLFSIPKPR